MNSRETQDTRFPQATKIGYELFLHARVGTTAGKLESEWYNGMKIVPEGFLAWDGGVTFF